MSVIKIKRSGVSGSPSALSTAELAYSYLAGTEANGGDRLYIGTGTEDANGHAQNIEVIGGKYFTTKLDHTPGTLTANSAVITDTNNKIDILNVDNITINGNEISSTDTDGNIALNPNGSGYIDASTSLIKNVSDPTAPQDAATKSYVDDAVAAANGAYVFAGDTGSDTALLGETVNVVGANASIISTTVTDNNIAITLEDTAVTPGTYGSESEIPVFTVDAQGRLTFANTVAVNTTGTFDLAGTTGTGSVELGVDTLTFADGDGNFDITASGSTLTFALNGGGNATFNELVVSGNLTVSGTTTTVNSNEVNIGDAIILLNSDETGTPSQDAGIEIERGTSSNVQLVWDETADQWTVGTENFAAANFIGDLTGNADTATALATSRNFSITGDVTAGPIAFDGTGNVTLNATIAADSVALGTDTTGDYVQSVGVTAGTGLSITGTGEGATVTIAGEDATATVKGVATFDETNFLVTSGDVTIATVDGGTY